ncbi:hypothetical protein BO87DRAFT_449001, partial [Aspergillus neoniger CBS 115656]
TYDHRVWKTGLPVRSAVLKPHAGRLVVGWVTTSESLLLYVFFWNCSFCYFFMFMTDKFICGICSRELRFLTGAHRGDNWCYRLLI